jgi:hypothetical protein
MGARQCPYCLEKFGSSGRWLHIPRFAERTHLADGIHLLKIQPSNRSS